MTAKHYLKVAAVAALALVSSVSTAGAQEKPQAKQKNQPLLSSVQVPPSEKDPAKLQAAAKVSAEQLKAAAIGDDSEHEPVSPTWRSRLPGTY